MRYTAYACIAGAYLLGLAVQALMWFALYKCGWLLTAILLALASLVLGGLGVYCLYRTMMADAESALDALSKTSFGDAFASAKPAKRVRARTKVQPA